MITLLLWLFVILCIASALGMAALIFFVSWISNQIDEGEL